MGGVTTYYVYDGQTMIREMQKNAGTGLLTPTATYFQGPRGPEYRRDDTQTETDGQGHTYGKTRWYVYDGLGSVVGEVDPLGNLTSSPKYDVYGAVRANGGSASSRQGFVGGLGHVTDGETGLVYMRARYYDPSVGRFVSEDMAKAGKNWFMYCNSNPINCVDQSGKDTVGLAALVLAIWNFMTGNNAGYDYFSPLLKAGTAALGRLLIAAGDALIASADADGVLAGAYYAKALGNDVTNIPGFGDVSRIQSGSAMLSSVMKSLVGETLMILGNDMQWFGDQ